MKKQTKENQPEKTLLHPRNPHRSTYDFDKLCKALPPLSAYVYESKYKTLTIDFARPEAVKMLNKALLKAFYGVDHWDIPDQYLCPPIPGRADYIHYMADHLASDQNGVIPMGSFIRVLDIGVGANCVYPIIGNKEYKWSFVGTDIDAQAIKNADRLRKQNSFLEKSLECRLQNNAENVFKGIILKDEFFDLTICNPPFHSSLEEATEGSLRKVKNLGSKNIKRPVLNFGGQGSELWCKGGEKGFINKMIEESKLFSDNCLWFSTLVAKSIHLQGIYAHLKFVKATEVKTIEMRQGQKTSRLVTWSFLEDEQRKQWVNKRWSENLISQ